MKSLHSFAIAIPLAAAILFAQSDSRRTSGQADLGGTHTYTGVIVDANCSQANALTGLSPSSSSDPTTATSSRSTTKKTAVAMAKKDVLKQCQPTASTTGYALLTEDGNFFKLDETGNKEVMSKMSGGTKKVVKGMKASINGAVEGDTLKVQSLTKM